MFCRLQIKTHCHWQLQNHGLSNWHPILWIWWCQCAVSHSPSCGWQACKCCRFWQSNSGVKKTSTVRQVGALVIPEVLKHFKWGLCQNQTENYCCGYKNSIFTRYLNLMTFFFNPFCIYLCIWWDTEEKNLKSKLRVGCHYTGYSVGPFFCQHAVWWPTLR